jgi:hypothetical protein
MISSRWQASFLVERSIAGLPLNILVHPDDRHAMQARPAHPSYRLPLGTSCPPDVPHIAPSACGQASCLLARTRSRGSTLRGHTFAITGRLTGMHGVPSRDMSPAP